MKYLEGIPQPLYKYRTWNAPNDENKFGQRLLTHNQVYFASPDEFNDPFDGALPFRYKESEMTPDNIFRKLREMTIRSNPHLPESEIQQICYTRQSTGVFENGQYWKENYPYFKNNINTRFGILSLSQKRDDILMWSHYADSHRGYCVGLDKVLLYERCQGVLGRVNYSDEFPEIGLFDENPFSLTILTTTKSTKWEYEDEYRIVRIDGAKQVINLPNEAILEIILGCNMPEADKVEIHSIAKKKFPHARVYESQINLHSFKLDLLPILNPQAPSLP
ncbi:MAG: DUF2971 domain-containing protein [Chitinophagales bacterium]|nr:DUF2971 domain-containing protein [Chitinophagales bacterium]